MEYALSTTTKFTAYTIIIKKKQLKHTHTHTHTVKTMADESKQKKKSTTKNQCGWKKKKRAAQGVDETRDANNNNKKKTVYTNRSVAVDGYASTLSACIYDNKKQMARRMKLMKLSFFPPSFECHAALSVLPTEKRMHANTGKHTHIHTHTYICEYTHTHIHTKTLSQFCVPLRVPKRA